RGPGGAGKEVRALEQGKLGADDRPGRRVQCRRPAAGARRLLPVSDAHTAVLLHEAVEALDVQRAGTYVDCTFGRGGHSRLVLARLGAEGRLLALDRDPEAVKAAREIEDPRFTIVHGAFGRLARLLEPFGITRVHGILLDLGMSSPQ